MDKREIEQILRDYHWMVREIARLRNMLDDAGDGLTAKYGIDMIMPKGKGGTNDPIHMEVARRDKQWKRIEKMENKIKFVQERVEWIEDERERTVLDCMLDGLKIVSIAHHMGLSERNVYMLRDKVVDRMAKNADFAGNAGKLRKSRVSV